MWPIVKGEINLHYGALACLEQNLLSYTPKSLEGISKETLKCFVYKKEL